MNSRAFCAAAALLCGALALSACNDRSNSGPNPAAPRDSPAVTNDTDGIDNAGRDPRGAQERPQSSTSPNPEPSDSR